jgi:hypothetical protein
VHDKELIGKHIEELSDDDKNRLEMWEKRFRKLVFAYWRKEELRIILKEGNKNEAMEQYLIWQKNVLADSIKEYFPVIDDVLDWQKEVFGWMELNVRNRDSYFENISTLEGVLVNSLDLGYTFQAVKAQILRQQSAGSKKGIKFNKVIWKMVPGQQN